MIDGFGLARVKAEGTPCHPDDLRPRPEWTEQQCAEWYARQLKAYNDYWGEGEKT